MASGAPLSIPAADRHLRKVIYGFWAACCSIFLGALALGTVRRLPPGLALFFAGFFILLGIAFFLIGLVELVRRSMGCLLYTSLRELLPVRAHARSCERRRGGCVRSEDRIQGTERLFLRHGEQQGVHLDRFDGGTEPHVGLRRPTRRADG